jgi:hypothetical protein
MLSKVLWLAGSAIFVLLGLIHLYYTYFTSRLDPRKPFLIDEMKGDSPRLTAETTIWRAWKGFNASHSAGAIFIGLVNIILSFQRFSVIEDSFWIPLLTILTSVFYVSLAKRYWFSVPFVSLLIATCCFIASPVFSFFV